MRLPQRYRARPEEGTLHDTTRGRNPETRDPTPLLQETAVLLQQMELKQAQEHTHN